jgi:transcriptional regulator with XRE-family HTH domain
MASPRPRLARCREAVGFTQEKLAEVLGVDRTTVGRWETGESTPQPHQRPRIAQTISVSLTYLDEILNGSGDGSTSCASSDDDQDPFGIESADEITRRSHRLGGSNVDEAKLTYLERSIDAAIWASEQRPPHELAPRVRDTRRWVDELLSGLQHPHQRERLYVAAVRLSGLLGALALDLGRWPSARAYGMEAFQLAEFLGMPELQAWARATQSLIEYYAGNYHDALAYAQDGQRLSRGGPQSVRLALNGEARALARLGGPGSASDVDDAVGRGFELLNNVPAADGVSPSLSVDIYCPARAAANAATAYLFVQDPVRVREYTDQAVTVFDTAQLRGPQALSRLDQATALLMGNRPDPEHACHIARAALAVAENEHFESVSQRAGEFVRMVEPWKTEPAVREVGELVRAYGTRPALASSDS